ncbi:MAG: CPBP family intramembrane metalloprotease [Lachnospiraceae bacterium]|nr:CPBP family intramembrane metalloprotease [Lachnospiraceae bacterium]
MKKKTWSFGRTLVTFTPALIMITLNIIVSVILVFGCAIVMGMKGMPFTQEALMEFVMPYAIYGTFVFQLIGLIIFGLWFKLWGRNKFVNPVKAVKPSAVLVALLAAVIMELLISVGMAIVSVIAPEIIENFNNMMEQAGVAEMTFVSFVATVFLAPIGEELVFRGVTVRLGKWAGLPFCAINIIQAVLFGVFHLNLVQGVYAFFIGLVLGYLGHRYKTLWVPILMHFFCNLYATLMGMVEISSTLGNNLIMAGIALILMGIMFVIMKGEKLQVAETSESVEPEKIAESI